MRQLIALYRRSGSEVVVALYPTYSEKVDAQTLAEFRRAFPGVPVIDLVTPFNARIDNRFDDFFVDADHVNPAGAVYLSEEMAKALGEYVK